MENQQKQAFFTTRIFKQMHILKENIDFVTNKKFFVSCKLKQNMLFLPAVLIYKG